MWKKIKKTYTRVSLITLGIFILGFFIYSLAVLILGFYKGNIDSVNLISITAIILSFPGVVNTLIDEFKPTKKTYKLSCQCPKCKHLIQMDMIEE
ncbi:hypothetical protein [Lysinibacillus sp. LZ02]|uniref:hypothetical protein n=1 Tax=Lysinibacillus sp. LZ02 TaxID=3420668 RepID=UPI003D3692AA